jgi:hypothetical protein
MTASLRNGQRIPALRNAGMETAFKKLGDRAHLADGSDHCQVRDSEQFDRRSSQYATD